jgi:hypothetical protein
VYYGHLFGVPEVGKNYLMRLPRQYPQRPFFPVLFPFTVALLGFALLPASAVFSVAQVTSNPTVMHFGSIVIGQTETLPASLTNTQSSSVTISAISSTSGEFSVQNLKLPLVLTADQTVDFTVTFAPTATGWSGGNIAFTSNASNKKLSLLIGGVGVANVSLVPSSSSLGFGSVAVGSASTLPMSLTNSGTTVLVVTQAQVAGTGFSLSGLTLPVTLIPKQSVTFNVTFTPLSASVENGSLVVPNGSLAIPLSGTGTTSSQLVLTPTALSFGNVDIGNSSTLPVTLTANGGSVTVSSSASSSSQFALVGATFPLTIASGQSVAFNVAFTPNTSGKTSGNLSLSSNASDSNAQEGVSGVGITAQSSVTLSWNASVSQVSGYNLYRGASQTGSYSKVNTALNASTTYTDSTVTSGQTYYYVATSVDSTGQESGYSPPVQAVIP